MVKMYIYILYRNNTPKAYQIVKYLTKQKSNIAVNIEDKIENEK